MYSKFFAIFSALFLMSESSFAFLNFNGAVARRWNETGSSGDKFGSKSDALILSAHIDPIPLVPVSFGLMTSFEKIDNKDWGDGCGSAPLWTDVGAEVKAWLPIPGTGISPFLGVRYFLWSQMQANCTDTFENILTTSKVTLSKDGLTFIPGISYHVAPLVSIFAMAEIFEGKLKAKVDNSSSTGGSFSGSSSTPYRFKSLGLGVSVGI